MNRKLTVWALILGLVSSVLLALLFLPLEGLFVRSIEVRGPICGTWQVISNSAFSPLAGESRLLGVTALAPDNIWAVGITRAPFGADQALVVHWNGGGWQQANLPPLGSTSSLIDIIALNDSDIWAVGSIDDNTLVLHWDGRVWSVVPSPNGRNVQENELRGIAAASPIDIWAVGKSMGSALALHWDGKKWSAVDIPKPRAIGNDLSSVTAISSNDVWAVGGMGFGSFQALIMHWDGVRWSLVPGPVVPLRSDDPNEMNDLASVAAINSNDVWAVGYTKYYTRSETLIARWNGIEWTKVDSPKPNLVSSGLIDIKVVTKDDIWAVGYSGVDYASAQQAVVEHWDGTKWSIISDGGLFREQGFYGSAIFGSGQLWAVGKAGRAPLLSLFTIAPC